MPLTYYNIAVVEGLEVEDSLMQMTLDGSMLIPEANESQIRMTFDVGSFTGQVQKDLLSNTKKEV